MSLGRRQIRGRRSAVGIVMLKLNSILRYALPLGQASLETMMGQCDPRSPIEPIFLQAAYDRLTSLGLFCAQYNALRYRLDFALLTTKLKLAIECDGYEFHHTEPQISADNDRDLNLECDGWRVRRFTGSKIYGDAAGCVEQVERLVRRLR